MGRWGGPEQSSSGRRLKAAALALALAAGPVCVRAQDRAGPPPAGGDDLLLFALRLGPVTLNECFPGVAAADGYRLPLGQLCQELDLAVQVDPDQGTASGFLVSEDRSFRLDVRAGTWSLAGVTRTLDRTLAESRDGDLYLDTRLLAQVLPLALAVDSRAAAVTVQPREQLPLQARWQREGQAGWLQAGTAKGAVFPPLPDPYRLLEWPALDVFLALNRNAAGGQGREWTGTGSFLGAGDFLGLTTSAYAFVDQPGGLADSRATLGRKDPRGNLLGPLQATEFGFGQVLSPGLNLAAAPVAGTGALVTNQLAPAGSAFDRHSFQGDLAPGWQVELYRNGTLVTFQASRTDGRYQFLNVPLHYGDNDFRLVFYGPQGQRRVEAERFDVSQNQVPPGVFHYHLAQVRQDLSAGGGRRTEAQGSYGLGEALTLFAGAARIPYLGRDHEYLEAGLQGFWKPLSGSFAAVRDQAGGSVAELALRTRLGALGLVGKVTEVAGGFQSEGLQESYGALRRRLTLEGSTVLPDARRPWLQVGFQGYRDLLARGGSADVATTTLATSLGRTYLSNQLSRTVLRGGAGEAPPTTGSLLASRLFPAFSLHGQASYTLSQPAKLDGISVSADTARFPPFSLQAGLMYAPRGGGTTVTLGAIKPQGRVSLGTSVSHSTLAGWSGNVNLRFGLALDRHGRSLHAKAQGAAAYGAAGVAVFLDANGNGVWDRGDQPLPGVALQINGTRLPGVTGADGRLFVDGLPEGLDANLAVVPETLEDPLMRPERPGVQITPRAGHVAQVELPVVVFGDLAGTAYASRSGHRTALAGLRLELRDGQGRVVKSLRTAYDGFYEFTDLPPGTYRLEVPPAQLQRMGARPFQPRTFMVSPAGSPAGLEDVIVDLPGGDPPPEGADPPVAAPGADPPAGPEATGHWPN